RTIPAFLNLQTRWPRWTTAESSRSNGKTREATHSPPNGRGDISPEEAWVYDMISKLLNFATKFGLPILAIGLIAFSVRYLAQAKERLPKLPPPVQPAANPFPNSVAGAGMVEPETENISVGAPLPGI